MLNKENFYSTEDFGFAAFLQMNMIDLYEIRWADSLRKQCLFVFAVDKDDPALLRYIKEWENSVRARELKRYGYSSKVLKKALKDFFIENSHD